MTAVKKRVWTRLLCSLVLSVELGLLIDAAFALTDHLPSGKRMLPVYALLFIVLFAIKCPDKLKWIIAALIPALCALAAGAWRQSLPLPG